MKKLKKIPKFKTEAEERAFWQNVDSTEYVDYKKLEHWSFPNLRLTSRPITIRLPESLIERIKIKAHQRDIPYQTYIKQLLFESLEAPKVSEAPYPVRTYPKSDIKKFIAFDKKQKYKDKK